MTGIIFDEFDDYFRKPRGAIEAPGSLRLRLKLRRGGFDGADVRYHDDDSGAEMSAQMRFSEMSGTYEVYECELMLFTPGLYWFHFLIYPKEGAPFVYDTARAVGICAGDFQITAYAPAQTNPDWLEGGVIYHIFVDRFRRGKERTPRPGTVLREDWGGLPHYLPDENGIVQNNDFFGGDFDGIIEKLPYLEQMGVTCIYLSPVFEAASNHKYDTGDFMKIDESFGGDEAFGRLCEKAREQGIRIILDGVFNHVGADSRYFNKYGRYDSLGAYQSRRSPYFDWFSFHEWNKCYDAWWGIELLPALNKQSGGYRHYICGEDGVIARWTKKGVSGWRLDVVDELPDVFLYPLCQAIRRENPDALIIGEVWEDASNKIAYSVRRRYFQGGQLDSVTNYPLKDAIVAFIKDKNAERLAAVMDSLCQNYPENVLNSLMNILGTHDTARILTVLGAQRLPEARQEMASFTLGTELRKKAKKLLKLASALQFTLPGCPCVYYGDEAGMEGGADPFNRRCYPWGEEDAELISWYKRLAGLRRRCACLKNGAYELFEARDGFFAFVRGSGKERILVAVNASDCDREVEASDFNYDILRGVFVVRKTVRAAEAAIFAIEGQ